MSDTALQVIAEALRTPADVDVPEGSDLATMAAKIALNALASAGYAVSEVPGGMEVEYGSGGGGLPAMTAPSLDVAETMAANARRAGYDDACALHRGVTAWAQVRQATE